MNYQETLDYISSSIFSLQNENETAAIPGLEVYQNNALGLAYKVIEEYYPTCLQYSGQRNLMGLVHLYFKKYGFQSELLNDFCEKFLSFIEESWEIHEDILLYELAKLDFLESNHSQKNTVVYQGVAEYWGALHHGSSTEEITVDTNQYVTIAKQIKNNEAHFIPVASTK